MTARLASMVLVTAAAWIAETPALAAPPRSLVQVDVAACSPPLAGAIHDLVLVELRTADAPVSVGPVGATRSSVVVTCSPDRARIDVRDEINGRHVERTLTLVDAPERDHARVIALSIVECLVVSWMPPEEPAAESIAPVSLPDVPAPTIRVVASPPPIATRPALTFVGADVLTRQLGPLWLRGGGLSVRRARAATVFGAQLTAEATDAALSLGRASAWAFGGALHAAWAPRLGPLRPELGGGVRTSWARVDGHPFDPTSRAGTASGAFGGPFARAALSAPLAGRLSLRLAIEAGVCAFKVVGTTVASDEVRLAGRWMGFAAGFEVRL